MEKKLHHRTFALVVLLALVVGSAAGIVASIIVERSLAEYAASLFSRRPPAVPDGRAMRATPTSYEGALERVRTTAGASVASVMPVSTDTTLSRSWLTEDNATGYGVVVSTDGWILFAKDALANFANPLRQAEVWIDGARYTPTKIIFDDLTDAVLLHVDANNLSPVGFGASEDVAVGTTLYVARGTTTLTVTSLVDAHAPHAPIVAAEKFTTSWTPATAPDRAAPIFDGSGDVLALFSGDVALPIHTVTSFVNSVLREGVVRHAGLGAYVTDLSLYLNIDDALRQGKKEGALIVSPPSGAAAILYNGPAAKAGLRAGDVVTSVDDIRVDAAHTLADIVQLYEPEQQATFSITRGGTSQDIIVTFGEYESLVY